MSDLVAQLRKRGNGDIADGYEDKTERGQLDLQVADELTALRTEFEAVRAERVQLETLSASRADEIHKLNNALTAANLERDALKTDAANLLVALKALWTETKLSGNAESRDYGWPKARKLTLEAIAKVEGQS